jgi:ribosome-associated protein
MLSLEDACAGASGAEIAEDDILAHGAQAAGIGAAGTGAGRMAGGAARSEALLALVNAALEDDKAEDIVTIDMRGRSSMADAMVICSGRSTRQVTAIAEKLIERLKEKLGISARTEGKETGDWVLIDAGDVIVHVFRPEVRDFYQLEKMWQPAGAPLPASAPAPQPGA